MCISGGSKFAILAILAICPLLMLGSPPAGGQHVAVSHKRSALSSGKADSPKPKTQSLSARCISVGETPDDRVSPRPEIAPGEPPLLSFRYYEGAAHHQYNHSDLMLDDAGH